MSMSGYRTQQDVFIECIHCHRRYDLGKAEGTARRLRRNQIRCPKCKKIIGHR